MTRTASDPPADFDGPMKTLYRKYRDLLRAQGTFQDLDASTLARLVRAEFRAINAEKELRDIAKAREVETGRPISPDGLTVKGSRGQDVDHPLHKVTRDAEHDAHKYATALKMHSEARGDEVKRKKQGGGKLGL